LSIPLESLSEGNSGSSPDLPKLGSKGTIETDIDSAYILEKSGLTGYIDVTLPKYENRLLCGFL